jgi:hypothetical protein
MIRKLTVLGISVIMALFVFSFTACEGPAGPLGPEGEQGTEGPQGETGTWN